MTTNNELALKLTGITEDEFVEILGDIQYKLLSTMEPNQNVADAMIAAFLMGAIKATQFIQMQVQ